MALSELFPFITVKHAELSEKWVQKDPKSRTVKLLKEPWNTNKNDTMSKEKILIKARGVGDKIAEEGVELGASVTTDQIIEESSQAIWTLMAAWIKLGIKPSSIFNLLTNLEDEPVIFPEKDGKLSEYAGMAVSRINGPGAARDKIGVKKRSADAMRAMHVLWESKGISPKDVGEKI